MMLIDPHTHMISRTTDDYEAMAAAGVVALIEPAFWIGQPRTHVGTYIDYLSAIVGWERFRAGQFGIRHYCTVGLNSKEANNEELAEGVMEILPRFALKDGRRSDRRDRLRRADRPRGQVFPPSARARQGARAAGHDPHPAPRQEARHHPLDGRDRGARPARPRKVVIDHNNEETVQEVLDRGYWAAFSIYPSTKMGNERMVEIVRQYGAERIIVDSACDWGISEPLGVAKTAKLALQRGIPEEQVRLICYQNALDAYGQSGQMREADWLDPPAIDQRTLYEGNSILRGGREPRVEEPKAKRPVEELVIE